ncbi:TIM barrel protein [Paracidobacterium acidisoli]|uniref:Hydroxypyruvate isomerase n=1 Tax=Paracidobacterium acidisoli TaxID=2303751 RepID=A0A372IPJ7_9BACT|nr:TIM barrel protein [Paracidobacterium acidisoli]MBT9330971.1 TIM barrel protein [Paracidobacterium acidisoli]
MNRRQFSQLIAAAGLGQMLPRGHAQTAPSTSGFRFSVMLWTLDKKIPFDHCLEIVADAGYEGVELVGEFHKWSSEETRRVMAKMRSLRLHFDLLSGVSSGFTDPSGTSALLAELTAQFNTAKELGSSQINLKSGPRIEGLSPDAQHAACVENLKRAADLAAAANIQILIEPIDPIESPSMYMTSVMEGFRIVREVNSPHVRVLYDFYHEQRAAGNLIEKLEQNFDLVALVHVADVPGRHEPGTGEIDYTNIYKKLAELKYDKFIAMEFYPIADPTEALRKARLDALQAQASVRTAS